MHIPASGAFRRCMFLINPVKSPGGARRLKRKLMRLQTGSIVESSSREHFQSAVRKFLRDDLKQLIIWGGDGSVHTAINEIMRFRDRPLMRLEKSIAFLRGGSGNGYHDSYLLPRRLASQLSSCAESMWNHRILAVDLLRIEVGDRFIFGQLAGLGFDVHVLKMREARLSGVGKVQSGFFNYLVPTVSRLLRDFHRVRRAYTLEVFEAERIIEERLQCKKEVFECLVKELQCQMLEIGKRDFYGNGFRICPDAVPTGGLMDIYLFNFDRRFQAIVNATRLWKGRYRRVNREAAGPFIEHLRAKRIRIYTGSSLSLHVDGELYSVPEDEGGGCRIGISVLPEAISILVPAGYQKDRLCTE